MTDPAKPEADADADADLTVFVTVESVCATCGRVLEGDPDEDPTGDAGMPICGECARERDFFSMDIDDGELDGRIDP